MEIMSTFLGIETPGLLRALICILVILLLRRYQAYRRRTLQYRAIPSVGEKIPSFFGNKKASLQFVYSAEKLIQEAVDKGLKCFQIPSASVPIIILHPCYIDDVKNNPRLTFDKAFKHRLNANYPGFEGLSLDMRNNVFLKIIRGSLTQDLGSLVAPISKEVSVFLQEELPYSAEWRSYTFGSRAPYIIARLSSVAFVGHDLCRNEDWLAVASTYVVEAFAASAELGSWPSFLRPFVHWFLPSVQRLRKHVDTIDRLVTQEQTRRQRGGKGNQHLDALECFQKMAGEAPFSLTQGIMLLIVASIHNTSHVLTNVVYDITAHPDLIAPLREEIETTLCRHKGITKAALAEMKLLDSVLRETLRMNPVSVNSMQRFVHEEVVLHDGVVLPKGAIIGVTSHSTRNDATLYDHPQRYNGYRFFNKRQKSQNGNRHQFVIPSTDHLGFGYGIHVCPGRFFAAAELMVFLIHLLLKYDWAFEAGRTRPTALPNGTEPHVDRDVPMFFRSRDPGAALAWLE